MNDYQAIARKFRPQKFCDVIGQEAIVRTLQNAIGSQRLSHAYLFCGSKGTGKTTLARLAAKAINCPNLDASLEPCNRCTSCREITMGQSLDVLEIDGASHRGIEDIRQINDTVAYAAASGRYKIYIIDEVHMLTKEAFNALLKTLEEPPKKVVFFFATTEPYKILPTILSRCQRFNLQRIPFEKIVSKLQKIAEEIGVTAEDQALQIVAKRAEGGLRDAESLFDQVVAFRGNQVTTEAVLDILGMLPKERFFDLDEAALKGDLAFAFTLSQELFSQGKDYLHFVDGLLEHYRNMLMVKLIGKGSVESHQDAYVLSAKNYAVSKLLSLIDDLDAAQTKMRTSPNAKIALEALLLRLLRIHQQLPLETIVHKLTELQDRAERLQSESSGYAEQLQKTEPQAKEVPLELPAPPQEMEEPQAKVVPLELPTPPQEKKEPQAKVVPVELPAPPQEKKEPQAKVVLQELPVLAQEPQIITPLESEKPKAQNTRLEVSFSRKEGKSTEHHHPPLTEKMAKKDVAPKDHVEKKQNGPKLSLKEQVRFETLLQFAAVELEGTLKRNQ